MSSKLGVWWMAARPKTLAATVTPVLVGTAAAHQAPNFSTGPGIAALLGGLLIQIGSNLANDLFDFKKGADTEERLGPTRVTQAGLLTPKQVAAGMISVFGLAVCIGFYLVAVGKWPVVIIGIASILSAIAYTGGPYPLGYHGLGEVFCFIFFGPVAVCGTAYVETLNFNCVALAASVPIGLLCANILVVNNLRDIETDVKAGKRTVAVRIGKKNTLLQYAAFVGASFVTPIVMVVSRLAPPTVLLTLLSLPIAVRLFLQIAKSSGKALNPLLGRTAQLELIFGALLTIGLYI